MIDLHKYKGIIFDLDGTLVDTERIHYAGFVEVLKSVGIEYISFEEHMKNNSGKKGKFIIEEYLKLNNINADLEELFSNKKKHFSQTIKEKSVEVIPGSIQFLQKLKKENYKLALVTGSAQESFDAVVSNSRIEIDNFNVLITGKDNYQPKPNPDGFLLAQQRLNLPQKEILIFEDSINGIKAANAADIDVCFVNTYLNEKDTLGRVSFNYSIKDFKELIF